MRTYKLITFLALLSILVTSCASSATQQPGAAQPTTAAEQPTTAPAAPTTAPAAPTTRAAAPTTAPAAPTTAAGGAGGKVTLTIESWRNDDLTIWQDTIIPAFEAKIPTSMSCSPRLLPLNTTAS